jgi:hypothetical protein
MLQRGNRCATSVATKIAAALEERKVISSAGLFVLYGRLCGDDARVRSVVFDRWGDPDNTGTWGHHPFGFEVTGFSTFDGVTIPSAGRAGWFYGTDRWDEGEFFRAEITDYHLVTEASR